MNRVQFRGFSLVELMVSLVIGMLAILFVTRAMVAFEQNRRSSLGGSDAMQNAMVSTSSIENDIGKAGWGVNNPQVFGCNASFSDTQGYSLAVASVAMLPVSARPLAPIVINFSAVTGDPDTITTYSGSSMAGSPSLPLAQDAQPGDQTITLLDSSGFGFGRNDVLVIAQADPTQDPNISGVGNCTVVEAASPPMPGTLGPDSVVSINIGGKRFSPPGGIPAFIENNNRNTRVYNLGPESGLAFHTWSIVNGRLMLRATELGGSSGAAQTVVSNVVSIKALYGFDTTIGGTTPRLTQWSRSMIDVNNNGFAGDMFDYQKVVAVRLAVVARSREAEKPDASGNCSATTANPVVFSSQEPANIPTIAIPVNVAVPGDSTDWKCYRYKVFESVIPIRNAGWK